MTTHKEPIPTTPLKWGQVSLMLLAAAVCAVYAPIYLVYAGLLRFAWCVVGGQPGRGLASLLTFGLVYLVVIFGMDDPQPFEADPHVTVAPTATSSSTSPSSPAFSSAVYVPALQGQGRR